MRLSEVIEPPIRSFKDLFLTLMRDADEYHGAYDFEGLPSVKFRSASAEFMMMLDAADNKVYDSVFGNLATDCQLLIDVEDEHGGGLSLKFTYNLSRKKGVIRGAALIGSIPAKGMKVFVEAKLDDNQDLAVFRELIEDTVKWKKAYEV